MTVLTMGMVEVVSSAEIETLVSIMTASLVIFTAISINYWLFVVAISISY